MLKELGEFLEKANGEQVAYLESRDENIWMYALPNSDYTFHFSVHTKDGEVQRIQARRLEYIQCDLPLVDYMEPPGFVRDAVDQRVEIIEDPDALAVLEDECIRCMESYVVTVMPKADLLIDGCYSQRLIQKSCPDCGQPLVQRKTWQPPQSYETSEVDLSKTWSHGRR